MSRPVAVPTVTETFAWQASPEAFAVRVRAVAQGSCQAFAVRVLWAVAEASCQAFAVCLLRAVAQVSCQVLALWAVAQR